MERHKGIPLSLALLHSGAHTTLFKASCSSQTKLVMVLAGSFRSSR